MTSTVIRCTGCKNKTIKQRNLFFGNVGMNSIDHFSKRFTGSQSKRGYSSRYPYLAPNPPTGTGSCTFFGFCCLLLLHRWLFGECRENSNSNSVSKTLILKIALGPFGPIWQPVLAILQTQISMTIPQTDIRTNKQLINAVSQSS